MTKELDPGEVGAQTLRDRTAAALEAAPYCRYLGIRLAPGAPGGELTFHMPFDARWIGNASLPAIHGGVLATFMQAAALTATSAALSNLMPPKLVDFSLDYLSSAGAADLYAQCEMHRVGRRIAAVGIRCWQRSAEEPVALGRAHVYVAHSASDASLRAADQKD
ncbi:PaaI family thioesterase [Variovorax sp. dw_308]|uniref:PaaI family thioesterase n=1 Tax=Variovorax sp. dw_308 TaxID=2721546 RepID=UPI001C4444FF|nr:PaaI family thioesterase [Variovorax sp. dw_308]